MAETKTYLNVPFAQKDAAKALGARWDVGMKKWYVPTGKDRGLFAQWNTDVASGATSTIATKGPNNKGSSSGVSTASNTAAGVFTYPTILNFIAYNGQEPPWD